jgi:hypothetical protein
MIIRRATLPKLAEFLREEDSTVLYPSDSLKQRTTKSFRKGANRQSHRPNFAHNQARLQARLNAEDDYLRMKSTNSIAIPSEDSPDKQLSISPQSCFSQILTKNKPGGGERERERPSGNPVIKIVEIDKQIYLKQAVKEEIRMFGLSSLQSQPMRYDCQPQITNLGEWKRRDKTKN